MKPIAQRCVLCHGDNGCFPSYALGSGTAAISLYPLGSNLSLGAHRSRITAHPLHAHIARISLGTGIPADTLRSPWSHWTGCAPRSRRSRTALIALYPTRTHGTPFSPRTLFSARSLRSHGSHRSLNGGRGSAGGLSVSPAIAAAILHNNLPLIG